jgi:hypothetical protein
MSLARTPATAASEAASSGPPGNLEGVGLIGRWVRDRLRIADQELSLEHRGFRQAAPDARPSLESVPRSFRAGYDAALDATPTSNHEDLRRRLEALPEAERGFAYEGAAMALALLDSFSLFRRDRWMTFAKGPGKPHLYMVYVGFGFAAARLRRVRAFARPGLDPHLRWLVLDGFGFHEGFFRNGADRPGRAPYRETTYALRAFDQGLGRSLWFVEGADPQAVAERVSSFPETRRADLWSGIGLAACYAGGAGAAELEALRDLAAEDGAHLAQGVAFAAEARERAGNATDGTERACRTIWNASSVFAAELVRRMREKLPEDDELPAYEVWRRRIRAAWAPVDGGVS